MRTPISFALPLVAAVLAGAAGCGETDAGDPNDLPQTADSDSPTLSLSTGDADREPAQPATDTGAIVLIPDDTDTTPPTTQPDGDPTAEETTATEAPSDTALQPDTGAVPPDTGGPDTEQGADTGPDSADRPSDAGNDACNTTAECKALYGPAATDCVDSKTDHSWCACGDQPCADTPADSDTSAPGSDPPDATSGFVHPGIFTTAADLAFVKEQLAAGREPWKTAFSYLEGVDCLSRTPHPYEEVPGSSDPKERGAMDEMIKDGEYAFACALMWVFTNDKRYADHAVSILNAWSIFKKIPMPLYLTWAVPHFLNAAELLKHLPGSGWKPADIAAFGTMVRKYMWPRVQPPPVNYGSNHGATANESQFAIAIFLDDRQKFETAVDNYKWLVPRYIFLNQAGRIDGECAETCRDLNHTKLGTLGLMYAAEAAWNQGVDLWKPYKTRYAKFAENHAGWMTGELAVPDDICAYKGEDHRGKIYCKGGVPWSTPSGHPPCGQTAWEILYNHVARRLGTALPLTKHMIDASRPAGTHVTRRNQKWETLLHAQRPF